MKFAKISPIFGVHVVLNRNAPPNADVIRSLGARVTTLWLYPAPGGRFNVSRATQMVDWITEQTGGLNVYLSRNGELVYRFFSFTIPKLNVYLSRNGEWLANKRV